MMKIRGSLWLLCLLAVGIRARPESAELLAASSSEYRASPSDHRSSSDHGRSGADHRSSAEHKPHPLTEHHAHDDSSETKVNGPYADYQPLTSAESLVSEQRSAADETSGESHELDQDAHSEESRMFNPAELFNFNPLPSPGPIGPLISPALINQCNVEGDMFYETRGDTCWVCGCFTNFGGLFAKCAPCTCSLQPRPIPPPIPGPIPLPIPELNIFPEYHFQPPSPPEYHFPAPNQSPSPPGPLPVPQPVYFFQYRPYFLSQARNQKNPHHLYL